MSNLNLGEANRQLSKIEYSLYFASEPRQIQNLSEKEIKSKIERLTKRIDKIKAQKQASTRARKGAGLGRDATALSKIKTKYFREALKRFKVELKERDTSSTPTPKKKKLTAKTRKKASAKVEATVAKQNLRANVKKAPLQKSAIERRVAHQSSRVRRSEGKRDSVK